MEKLLALGLGRLEARAHNQGWSTTTTSSAAVNTDGAAARIAAARCAHEAACNRIGEGRRFGTNEACALEYTASARQDLDRRACRTSIESSQLDACVAALRGESCDPLDTLGRMKVCSPDALCAKAESSFTVEDVYGP